MNESGRVVVTSAEVIMKVPAWLFGLSVLLSLGAVVAVVSVVREVRQLRQEVAQLREDRPAL